MARDVSDDIYYMSSGGKVPVKWTAPEVSVTSVIVIDNQFVAICIVNSSLVFSKPNDLLSSLIYP